MWLNSSDTLPLGRHIVLPVRMLQQPAAEFD